MTCTQTAGTSAWENCAGVPQGLLSYPGLGAYNFSDSQYGIVALRNRPTGTNANFPAICEANLRARGLIYYKKTPGDCGGGSAAPGGFTSGQIVGLSGTASSGIVGGLGAAGVLSGPATLGIGTAVSLAVAGIEAVFQHHAQAVANEQATICAVANYFNPIVKQIDKAVATGAISPDEGITYMRQVTQQAISGLQSIYKVCNAACYYIGYLRAHADLVTSLYPALAPAPSLGAQAPGSAPATFGTPPGGVPDSGPTPPPPPIRATLGNTYAPAGPSALGSLAPPLTPNKLLPSGNTVSGTPGSLAWTGSGSPSDYLNQGYNQQTGQSAQAADVPNTFTISPAMILFAALAIILFLVFA